MTNSQLKPPRTLTQAELAALIKGYRALRQWSQEELAEWSMLKVDEIAEVENGLRNEPQTLRALAQGLDFADPDVLNKPIHIPGAQDDDPESESADAGTTALEAFVVSSGDELGELVLNSTALAVSCSFELGMQADKVFEALTDYMREYRDLFKEYSESRMRQIHEEFQEYLLELKGLGVSLSYATRNLPENASLAKGLRPSIALYLVAFPVGEEPESFLVSLTDF
jgi:transcriptional regulator with XRE-family HTH domain